MGDCTDNLSENGADVHNKLMIPKNTIQHEHTRGYNCIGFTVQSLGWNSERDFLKC